MSDITERVRRLRAQDIAQVADTPRPTALRRIIPEMLADGVIRQRGRSWYGRITDIEQWLLGRWTPPAAAAPPPSRQTRSPARGKP